MKHARIIKNIAQEVIDFDPVGRFHPDVAALFEPVPDEVNQGAVLQSGVWTLYVAPEPVVVEPIRMISTDDVRKSLTLSERTKWDNDSAPEIVTAKIEFAQPRTIFDASEILDFLVSAGAISQASADKAVA